MSNLEKLKKGSQGYLQGMKKDIMDIKPADLYKNKDRGIDPDNMGEGTVFKRVKLEDLVPFPGNRSIEGTDIPEFADSMLEHGFHSAILLAYELDTDETVTNKPLMESMWKLPRAGEKTGRYLIIGGNRRFAAATLARKKNRHFLEEGIPAFVLPQDVSWAEILVDNYLDNENIKALSPKEKIDILQKLQKVYSNSGKTEKMKTIAKKMEISQSAYYEYDAIANGLIPELIDFFNNGTLLKDVAVNLSYCTENTQKNVLKRINNGEKIDKELASELRAQDKKSREGSESRISDLEARLKQQNDEIDKLTKKLNDPELSDREQEELSTKLASKRRSNRRINSAIKEVRNNIKEPEEIARERFRKATNDFVDDIAKYTKKLKKNTDLTEDEVGKVALSILTLEENSPALKKRLESLRVSRNPGNLSET